MTTVVNIGFAVIAVAVVLAVIIGLVAIVARVAGYGWTRGRLRAQRGVVLPPGSTHGHNPPELPAPRGGGLCAVGHYVPGSLTHCYFLHSYSARRTAGAAPGEVEQARHTHDTHKAEADERMAAGGW